MTNSHRWTEAEMKGDRWHEAVVRHISSLYAVFPVKWTKKLKNKGYLSITRRTTIQHPVWLETPSWHNSTGLLTVFMKIKNKIKQTSTSFGLFFFHMIENFIWCTVSKNCTIGFIHTYAVNVKTCQIYIVSSKLLKYKQINASHLKQWKTREACIIHHFMNAVWNNQFTRNHHLHLCVNMLRCLEKKNHVSESLKGKKNQK